MQEYIVHSIIKSHFNSFTFKLISHLILHDICK